MTIVEQVTPASTLGAAHAAFQDRAVRKRDRELCPTVGAPTSVASPAIFPGQRDRVAAESRALRTEVGTRRDGFNDGHKNLIGPLKQEIPLGQR